MFAYLYPRAPATSPIDVKKYRFPPEIMKSAMAAQEREISAYRRRLNQIHEDEKRRKENPPAVAGTKQPLEQSSVAGGADSVWKGWDRILFDDENLPVVVASPNPDPVPESPVLGASGETIDSEEALDEGGLLPVEVPSSPLPERPLSIVNFIEWLAREEEETLSSVATTPSPPASPVSEVHSVQDMQSLHTMFPTISPTTITKIVEHEFKPIDLARLNPRRRWDQFESGCSLDDYPSLHSLLVPVSVYFAVLQAGVSATSGDAETTRIIGHGGLQYMAHLIELEELFEWPAVVQYHMQFHNKRRHDMVFDDYSPWMVADRELIMKLLVGPGRQRVWRGPDGKLLERDSDGSVKSCQRKILSRSM